MPFEYRAIRAFSDDMELAVLANEYGIFKMLTLCLYPETEDAQFWDNESFLVEELYPALQNYANRTMSPVDFEALEDIATDEQKEELLAMFQMAEERGWFTT